MVQVAAKDKLEPSIENKGIRVEVIYKQMWVEKSKGAVTIPLAPLKKTNIIEDKIQIRKKDNIQLSYLIKSREALLKHTKVDVTTIHSFHIFPEFDKDAPVKVQKPSPSKPAVSKSPAKQEEKKTEEPVPAATGKLFEKRKYPPLILLPQANDPLASLTQQEVPAGFTIEQVKDPANPDLIDCYQVLKIMTEELEKARPSLAAEGRRNDNKVVSDNWSKAMRKTTILEAKFGNGEIEPPQYAVFLKGSIEKDKTLAAFYKSKGDNDRLAFMIEKIKVCTQELKELEEALAGEA